MLQDEVVGENERYLESHPALRQMCADFVAHLLFRKPDDPITEGRRFFTSLGDPRSVVFNGSTGDKVSVPESELTALSSRLDGNIVLPSDQAAYLEACTAW